MDAKISKRNTCAIEDNEFCAVFDGKRWTAEWSWTVGPRLVKNNVASYNCRLEKENRVRTRIGEIN